MSRSNDDVDPEVEAAVRRLLSAADDLESARLRLERLDVAALFAEPVRVDAEFMANLAESAGASDELRRYAARVRAGECRWAEIDWLADPVPPEVADIKSSDRFVWTWGRPASPDDDGNDNRLETWLV